MKAELPKIILPSVIAKLHTASACPGVKYSLMKSAAIGVRVHSGWGAVVAVAGSPASPAIIERSKITIIDPKSPGAMQPYHYAASRELAAAEKHIARSAADCNRLAVKALTELCAQLRDRGFAVTGAAILLSSAKPLPALDKILAAHPMIHTAEGEFFRQAFRHAFESLSIPVTGIRERDVEAHAQKTFGRAATEVQKWLNDAGRALGPPWTTDQKAAALAAAIVLAQTSPAKSRASAP